MIHIHHYKRLAENMISSWKILFWASLALLIMAVVLSIFPILVQQILHATFIKQNTAAVQSSLLAISVLLIIFGLSNFVGHYLMRKAGNHLCMQLNSDLFNTLLNLPAQHYQYLDKHQSTNTALGSIKRISQSAMRMITVLVRDSLTIIGLIFCLFWIERDFALLVLLVIPFATIIFQVIQGQHATNLQSSTSTSSKLACHLQRSIKNFRQIRIFGGQHQEYLRLKKEALSIQQNESQQANYKTFVALLCQLVMLFIAVAIIYLMTQQALRGLVTLDQIGAFVIATLLLITPVNRLAGISQTLHNEQNHLERVFSLLDLNADSDHNHKTVTEVAGKLTFEHVCFFDQKPEKPALNRVDLEITPKETVAIVCKDKQVRSQLIDLLLGFYQPAMGKMLLDNVPFTEIKQHDLLAQFALVSDEPVILNENVAGNIAYGITRCAHEASITATTLAAQASKFIREMPNGLQTRVDENGASMTNEQWQKIEIARALLKNAPILIMDNLWLQPTAETSFNKALLRLIQNRTTIIIMQAMPTTRQYIDHVYVVEHGVINEK